MNDPRPPSRVDDLVGGLACITQTLCAVGLGPVNLGRLARHMLKLSPSKPKPPTPRARRSE
jgi:hypothetical protein